MKYDFFIDPGHSWLKVPRKTLVQLGIETEITDFSFQRGDYAYLEEDCDVTTFARALRARGEELSYRERVTNRNSKIRGYERFKPTGLAA